MDKMTSSQVWESRGKKALSSVVWLLSIITIYLASELLIWGLSRVCAPVNLQFFASTLGMILLFLFMTVSHYFIPSTEDFYHRRIKEKVCALLHVGRRAC